MIELQLFFISLEADQHRYDHSYQGTGDHASGNGENNDTFMGSPDGHTETSIHGRRSCQGRTFDITHVFCNDGDKDKCQ